jgi:hypothetical protein
LGPAVVGASRFDENDAAGRLSVKLRFLRGALCAAVTLTQRLYPKVLGLLT